MAYQIGVDVGGTFTDLVAVNTSTGEFKVGKVPSTPENQAHGVLAGLKLLDVPLADVEAFIHGTTVGTNAVLERKGSVCGLITTRGFRDTLELGRRTRPNNYGLTGSFLPLIPRELRLEVPERMSAAGEVVLALDEAAVLKAARELLARGAESVVIHFMHSYVNPEHELRAAEIVKANWPNEFVTIGHEILREAREFERASTGAVNAYIQPKMSRYLSRLSDTLVENGLTYELLVMQGNAGTTTAKGASAHAAQTVMSGPAAGALAAAYVGQEANMRNIIACDMGGTSFDVTLVRDGQPSISAEKDIGYAIPVRVPMIDVHTIGAGGGSIARVTDAGLLQVGPESAGARPGPICYGRGGTEPTVTDANLVLGRLDPASMPGVEGAVDVEKVKEILVDKIGRALGLDAIETATAIIAIATNHLAGAIRLVSIERGQDPRDFALFAFGGAGPLHACALAAELGIPHVLVPRFPGATSALGCTLADMRHDFVRSVGLPLLEVNSQEMTSILAAHSKEGLRLIQAEAVPVEEVISIHEADLLFRGQSHVFRTVLSGDEFNVTDTAKTLFLEYKKRFEIDFSQMEAMLVNLRTTVVGRRRKPTESKGEPVTDFVVEPRAIRTVHFGGVPFETPILRRENLPVGSSGTGPAIIEQMDSTTVVDPLARWEIDFLANLKISVGQK